MEERYAVVSCHVERPLDDRIWERFSRLQARQFYIIHKDRPFYEELVEYMVSAPVVVQVLEGDNAVAKHRELMGATDPSKAAPGTIRKEFALSIGENSVHGSDSAENAEGEIRFFFSDIPRGKTKAPGRPRIYTLYLRFYRNSQGCNAYA